MKRARRHHAISALALAAGAILGFPAGAETGASGLPAAAQPQRQEARPNILVWMMDDVGFAQLGAFGGLIATPNIDRVARTGLRYANYYTPPICSAARASFLTGRNTHTVHMGAHAATPRDLPGYDALVPPGAGTLAENLQQAGYATFALGKWDHVPMSDVTPAGPTTYWPQRQGFDRFYGFLAAETDNFHPLLWDGNTPVDWPKRADYHLTTDLADRAISMLDSRHGRDPAAPFFMYFATGVAHAPHHAPPEWIARYKGKFDMGWDKARETILKRQKAQGLVPAGTQLSPRPEVMPPWDGLSAEQKRLYTRQMEVFAAAVSHADEQFGRILDRLQAEGELDNTIVVVLSDNGASAEGGPGGSFNELLFATGGGLPSLDENMRFYDRWGGPGTHPHYAMGWAVAGNTPFRNYKQTTYEGGVHVPLIVSWPSGITAHGELRGNFVHASDLTPTLLSAAGVEPAAVVNNVPQMPFDGRNFSYSFKARAPAGESRAQYFEMYGHRGLWADGWKIVSPSKLQTWDMLASGFTDKPWELYNLKKDPGERTDLAPSNPAKRDELVRKFEAQAERFHVNPIAEQSAYNRQMMQAMTAEFARRQGKWRFPAPVSRLVGPAAPPLGRGHFAMQVDLDLPTGRESGPIFSSGGDLGGAGLYLREGRPVFVMRTMAGDAVTVAAPDALPAGDVRFELSVTPVAPGDRTNPARVVTMRAGGRTLVSQQASIRIPMSSGETFDIGRDNSSAIGEGYAPESDFPGKIRDMTFTFP